MISSKEKSGQKVYKVKHNYAENSTKSVKHNFLGGVKDGRF